MSDLQIKFNEDGTIRVNNVRLSYEHIFTPYSKEEKEKKKYSGRFILPESTHAKEIELLQAHNLKLQKEYFKARIKSSDIYFRDGDELGKDEYEDTWYIAASETHRPQVIGKRREVITQEDDIVYSGCYVNVLIRPWKQDNTYGKKINANLLAVQFNRDGERFGAERPDVNEHFEDDESSGASDFDD